MASPAPPPANPIGAHATDDVPPQAPQVDNRRQRTKVRDNFIAHLEENSIPEGETTLEPKMPPGEVCKSRTELQTNAFGIKTASMPLYHYHIEMTGYRSDRSKAVFLTKRSNDDCIAVDRKTRCREAIQVIWKICTDVFSPENKCYYDLQSTLLTTMKLPEPEIQLPLTRPAFDGWPSLQSFSRIVFDIKQCNTERDLNTGDMSMATFTDFEQFDRSHQAFVELVTSQYALFHEKEVVCLAGGKTYLMQPEKNLDQTFVDRCNRFSEDKFIGIGCKKSAKYVEGPNGRNHKNTVLFIDPLKTAFYRQQTVAQFLQSKGINVNDKVALQRQLWQLKGLHIFNPHLPGKRTFQITGFARETARTKTFTQRDGSVINVADYFYQKYHVECRFVDAPLITGKGPTSLLPIDHAMIDDNQPVPKNKMSQREDADMIKLAAQAPCLQIPEVKGYIGALGLDQLNLNEHGIKMVPNGQLKVKGRILQNPTVVYADQKTVVPAEDGLWNIPKKYFRGSECKIWAVLRNGTFRVNVREFINAYVAACRRNGIQIADEPIFIETVSHDGLEPHFARAKHEGVTFMVHITDKLIKNQGDIKLLERQYEIITQNITERVCNDAAGRGTATLENIVAKTNPKLGGTNYSLRHNQDFITAAFGQNCIIIGVALSHSGTVDDVQRARGGTGASTELSSVGYAANTGQDFYEFIGDYVPNPPHRSEILDIIPGIIHTSVNKYKENKGYFPSSMILYLNGSSEGEFALLKRFEVPLVRRQMMDIIGQEIPLTVIIPQRSHVARIYKMNPNPSDKPGRQNVQPGVVVDQGLVHPTLNEFYLNSHTAIQGTARTPKYTILFNNNEKASMDAMEHITYYLCFVHQIVNSPTSLPAPVYCAMSYAERGQKLFKVLNTSDADVINERWIYDNSEVFRNKRINA